MARQGNAVLWTGTCDCPARKMSAPILDIVKAADTKLVETKAQDRNAHSKAKDDNAEKTNAPDSESVDRFDTQKPSVCY